MHGKLVLLVFEILWSHIQVIFLMTSCRWVQTCTWSVKFLNINLSCVTFLFENMTGAYTEDTLKTLNKTYLIDLFLEMQDQTNSTIDSLMVEMKNLNNSFKRLESTVQIIKSVNNSLLKQLEYWRAMPANDQYSQRELVEVIGIPKTVESMDLEHTVC